MVRDLGPGEEQPPIADLRLAMARIREVQSTSGGLAISMARYEMETEPINRQFLAEFLKALPVGFAYSNNMPSGSTPDRFTIKDPLNLRAVAAFGVFLTGVMSLAGYTTTPGFVIGERVIKEGSVSYTDLLIASVTRRVGNDSQWHTTPAIYSTRVVSDQWDALRDSKLRQLTTPYPSDVVTSSFSPGSAVCVAGTNPNRFGIPHLRVAERRIVARSVEGLGPRTLRRALGRTTKFADNVLGCTGFTTRTLRSSDFEAFNVMSNLEYIAAALAVGQQLDDAKARRDAAMPPHPFETALELPGYRQTVEGDFTMNRSLPE